MTSQLKNEFDSIELSKVFKRMFDILDETIEYAVENIEDEVSSLDIIDYITDSMQNYLEDRGGLNEDLNFEAPTNEQVWDALEKISSYSKVNDYMNMLTGKQSLAHQTWTISDWEEDFKEYISNEPGYLGDDYISEEEILKDRLARNAGL